MLIYCTIRIFFYFCNFFRYLYEIYIMLIYFTIRIFLNFCNFFLNKSVILLMCAIHPPPLFFFLLLFIQKRPPLLLSCKIIFERVSIQNKHTSPGHITARCSVLPAAPSLSVIKHTLSDTAPSPPCGLASHTSPGVTLASYLLHQPPWSVQHSGFKLLQHYFIHYDLT